MSTVLPNDIAYKDPSTFTPEEIRGHAAALDQMGNDLDALLRAEDAHGCLAFQPRRGHGDGVGRRVVYRSALCGAEGSNPLRRFSFRKTTVRENACKPRLFGAR